jgi:hypothetical protein
VSFLMPLGADKRVFIESILSGIGELPTSVLLAIDVAEREKLVRAFVEGYYDDEKDLSSVVYNTAQIPLMVKICGSRKSVLHVSRVSDSLAVVDFWFFGSEWDEEEWGQLGIKSEQVPSFKDLLVELYDQFRFPLGTVGIEKNALELFDANSGWPDESYSLARINVESLLSKGSRGLLRVIVNRQAFGLDGSRNHLEHENSIILDGRDNGLVT